MSATREVVPWAILSVVVAAVMVGAVGLVRVGDWEIPLRVSEPSNRVGVILTDSRIGEQEAGLRGELVLKDPTPLFLPHKWNSGQVDERGEGILSPGTSFTAIEPKLIFPEAANDIEIPDGVDVPLTALSAIERIDQAAGHGELTRWDGDIRLLSNRRGYSEVMTTDGSKMLYQRVLDDNMVPFQVRAPVEALLAINEAGVWVRPTVIETPEGVSVNFEEINSTLKALQLESILGPGIYRILLGP